MSAVEDRLAAIIAEQMRTDGWTCEYHEPTSREGECGGCDESLTRTARAVAAVIASSDDLAVVELPKLKPLGSFGARAWNATFTEDDRRCMDGYDSYAHVEVDSDGLVELDTSAEYGLFADEAEQVAAALLAAAKAAEGVSDR